MYRPTSNNYFSGAGLLDLGFVLAGVDVRQSLEIDIKCIETLKMNSHYFNHKIVHEDIAKVTVLDQEKTDIMAFTYPCTKYSAIGDIHGVRTGDELYLHALRHAAVRLPEMFVVENVPGMKKFPVVMEAMTKLPGYYYNIFCPLNATNWVPQDRKRLIIFATRKPFSITEPSVCNKRPKMRDIVEKDPVIELPDCAIARLNGKYRDKPIIVDPDNDNAIAPTCVAHYHKDKGTRLIKDDSAPHGYRSFTAREFARLQGVPDDFILPEGVVAYKQIGNGVEVNMARWMGEQAVKYFN